VPIIRDDQLDIISHSPEQTIRLGARLGKLLAPGDIICLSGEMGAGKTVFASGIGQGWGTLNAVTSPTFTVVHQHRRKGDSQRLHHLDLYRIQDEAEVDSIGWEDILDDNGPVILEWPEHIRDAIPTQHLWIAIRVIEVTRRNLLMEGVGKRYTHLLNQFREQTFGV